MARGFSFVVLLLALCASAQVSLAYYDDDFYGTDVYDSENSIDQWDEKTLDQYNDFGLNTDDNSEDEGYMSIMPVYLDDDESWQISSPQLEDDEDSEEETQISGSDDSPRIQFLGMPVASPSQNFGMRPQVLGSFAQAPRFGQQQKSKQQGRWNKDSDESSDEDSDSDESDE